MRYYYFHGYGSSPQAVKANIMREILGEKNIFAPDFNKPVDEIVCLFNDLVEEINSLQEETCIVGSSLGGLYALYVSAKTKCNTILLNPALIPMIIVPKVSEEVPIKNIIIAQEFSLYAYEHYDKEKVSVWVTDDPLINHNDITKPYFYKSVKEYILFDNAVASGHEFIGFKDVFKNYIQNCK